MTTAFLFPGQGTVFAAMGRDLAEGWEPARRIYERAAKAVGRDAAETSFEASRKVLQASDRAHLAVFLHSLAAASVLAAEGVEPTVVAGHSLGQLAAVTVAGSLELEEAVSLVARRGRLLAAACRRRPGGMIAVRGAARAVESALADAGVRGLVVANVNCPAETVLSGESAALRAGLRALREARLAASPLAVDGPFHSEAMAPAEESFRRDLDAAGWQDPACPVVSSRDGRRLESAAAVHDELIGHIVRPVLWDRAMETLAAAGVEHWIEVGPGKTLTGLVARRDRHAARYVSSRARDLAATCQALGRAGGRAPSPAAPASPTSTAAEA